MINFPNVPDHLHKIFLSIGIFIIGFSIYSLLFPTIDISRKHDLENQLIKSNDELSNKHIKAHEKRLEIIKTSELTAHEYNVDNPFQMNGDTLKTIREFDKSKTDTIIKITLQPLINDLDIIVKQEIYQIEKKSQIETLISKQGYIDDYEVIGMFILLVFGMFLFITGLNQWDDDPSKKEPNLTEKPIINYEKYCQSCARNFTYLLKRGKTKKGKQSKLFCSECYSDGKFTEYLTAEIFQEYKTKTLNSRNRRDRKRMKRRFNYLQRWKEDEFENLF